MSHHHRRDSGGDVVHVIPTNNPPPPENWFPNLGDSAVWATEDDYNRVWAMNHDGDNGPPNKKSRGSPSSSSTAATTSASNRTKAIGKMFFKTKLCCKFRAGTCPYVTNCNFAHTVEELRRPPANWQEIVAAHEEERTPEPREEFQIPSLVSSSTESGRSFKGRHCKKFYTEEGCPYGEKLHRFGGGLVEGESKDGVSPNADIKQTGPNPKGHSDTTPLISPGVPHHTDASYHGGVALQRASSAVTQKPGIRTHQKWKGPAKISRIYGDWIDDIE
ncbi:unnamed protein product [Arabis nemorensis]|uniref:C3H1-type domain-containing protein n=1 Tax=Arabis nemorensis TaxID=586526 RepID=A0A565AXH3_9BRAS|nr:unnamed protein product [Arabis nemorensis]